MTNTKTVSLQNPLRPDDPWRRLPSILSIALLIWVGVMWGFGLMLGLQERRAAEPKPIEAQFLDLTPSAPGPGGPAEQAPAPPAPPPPPVRRPPKLASRPKPPLPPKPAPPSPESALQPPVEKPAPPVQAEENPSSATTEPAPAAPSAPAQNEPTTSTPSNSSSNAEGDHPVPSQTGPTAPSGAGSSSSSLPGGGGGARAIFQPKPEIPDDLREEALHAVAVARFHIAADGTSTVELITPTPNLKLNKILLDTLKSWRFFPAMKDGRPVASVQDLRVSVDVK